MVLPGNGFSNVQSCMQERVGSGTNQHYYQFSRLLGGIIRDVLLREARFLCKSITDYFKAYYKFLKLPPSPSPIVVPIRNGKCLSFPGRKTAPLVGVSSDASMIPSRHGGELPESYRAFLDWGSVKDSVCVSLPLSLFMIRRILKASILYESSSYPVVLFAFSRYGEVGLLFHTLKSRCYLHMRLFRKAKFSNFSQRFLLITIYLMVYTS